MRRRAAGAAPPPAAFLGAGFAILVWGITPAITKLAVEAIDPLTVGLLRTVLAALPSLPVALALRLRLPADAAGWGFLAVSSIGGFIGFPLLFSLGVARTTTAHAALIIAIMPALTGLFGAVVERVWPGRRWWRGIALALGGEVLLIGARFGFEEPGATLAGDLLCLGAALVASAGYVAGSRLAPRIGSWSTTLWGLSLGGLVQLPVLILVLDQTAWRMAGGVGFAAVGYLALFSTVLAYVAWYWALAVGGTARIGSVQFAQPVIAVVVAVTLLGEALTPPLTAATVAVLAGIAIAQRG